MKTNLNHKNNKRNMSVNKIYLLDHGKISADLAWFLPTPMTEEEMKTLSRGIGQMSAL